MLARNIRNPQIALLVFSLVGIAGVSHAGKEVTSESRHAIEVGGESRVIITNGRGKTTVVGKPGNRVVVLVTKHARARSTERANTLLDNLEYDISTSDNTIVIETRSVNSEHIGKSFWTWVKSGKEYAYIDYSVEVPQYFGVETSTTSGEVRVSEVTGEVTVSATSGDVVLRGIAGMSQVNLTSGTIDARDIGADLSVNASSGSAVVEGIKGSFVMRATSGDVVATRIGHQVDIKLVTGNLDLDGCLGSLLFETSSGDARIFGVEGNIDAFTSSGDLNVMILPVGDKRFVLSSSSGDIDVIYPMLEDLGFLLDINTSNGRILGDLPIKVEEITRHRLRGIVGTGTARVLIETASGDVKIIERKHAKLIRKKEEKN